jgi:serine/threonine-protein kinase
LRYALELDPGYSPARVFLAMLLGLFRYDESIDVATRALALDPLSPPLNLALGRAYLHAGRKEDALRPLRSVVDIAPGFAFAQTQLGHALMQTNRKTEALDAFRRAADGGSLNDRGHLAWALAVTGEVEAAEGILRDLLDIEGGGYLPPFGVALAYVGIGDLDAACDWLERGEQERSPQMCTIGVAPGIGALRGHPRFEALLRRMALDDASLAGAR